MIKTKLKVFKYKLIKLLSVSKGAVQPLELANRHQAIILKILSKDAELLIKAKMNSVFLTVQ
jgi:hypothetical protein